MAIADSCGNDAACGKYDAGNDVPVVLYIGSPGEANRVVASRAGDEVTVSDPGATVTVGESCRSAGRHTAVCTAAPNDESLPSFVAQLGDGDDAATVSGSLDVRAKLDGGPGDDTLTGGAEEDTLDGGPGADRIDGGAERDTLSFAGRDAPVTVDLAAGRTSDGDVVSGVERAEGGNGPDRLLGGPAAEFLTGGPGDDVVRGSGGDDTLEGDIGADTVEGGGGRDHLSGDPPQGDDYYTARIHLSPDVLSGGAGNDVLSDSGGANRMDGGPGNDILVGGSGRDRLSGGPGKDRLFGGSGADDLRARDGRRDRVDCGRGRDRARADAKDAMRNCETLRAAVYTPSG